MEMNVDLILSYRPPNLLALFCRTNDVSENAHPSIASTLERHCVIHVRSNVPTIPSDPNCVVAHEFVKHIIRSRLCYSVRMCQLHHHS